VHGPGRDRGRRRMSSPRARPRSGSPRASGARATTWTSWPSRVVR